MQNHDIRDDIFQKVKGRKYLAQITVQDEGILSGIERLRWACKKLGIRLLKCKRNGAKIKLSEIIAILSADAKQIALGEEELIGWILLR